MKKNEIAEDATIISKTGHSYEDKLSPIDREYHGYKPTCGDTTEYKDKAEHTFTDNVCTGCGYELKADTSAYAGKYISYSDEWEGWTSNPDFYIEIGDNSDGIMYERYYDYSAEQSEIVNRYELSVEISGSEITITYSDDNGQEYVREGIIGDNIKLGTGALLFDWGGKGYYFVKKDCSIWVQKDGFVLRYYDSNVYSIIGYYGADTDLVIPDTINEIPVTAIEGSQVFASRPFKSVKIGDNITSIGKVTFYNCTSLESIHIGASLTNIDDTSFESTSNRKTITVSDKNPELIVSGNCLINEKTKTLLLGTVNSVIPSDGSVETIATRAFYTLATVGKLEIPQGVKYILGQAFMSCKGLTEIHLPVSLEAIAVWSFASLSNSVKIVYAGTEEAWERMIEASDADGYIMGKYLSWYDNVEPDLVFENKEGGPSERVALTIEKSAHTVDKTYIAGTSVKPTYRVGETATYAFVVYDKDKKADVEVIAFVVDGVDKKSELKESTIHDETDQHDGSKLYTYTFTINHAMTIKVYEEGDEYDPEDAKITLDYDANYLNVAFITGTADCHKGDEIKLGIKILKEDYVIDTVMVGEDNMTDKLAEEEGGEYDKYLSFNVEKDVTVKFTVKTESGEEVPTTYSVTIVPSDHGRVYSFSNLTDLAYGTTVTLLITGDAGYKLGTLTVNGEDVTKDVSKGIKYTLTVTCNVTVTATFVPAT